MGPVSAQVCVSTAPSKAARQEAARRHRAWGKLGIARLRLDLVRLATRLVGRDHAQELVQRAFRAAVRLGPNMPRDRANIPSATHMGALVRRIAKTMPTRQPATPGATKPRRKPAARKSDSVAHARVAPSRPSAQPIAKPRASRVKKPAAMLD
ncbi:MAG: hypothetical protein K2W85_05065 [Phycisphaerales bacterium]|nr:hypothetical protein [Phycisphaerales bacterium]